MAYAWRILDLPKCATDVTPLVTKYAWRILICATHSLPISGASARRAIDKLYVAHIRICATSRKKCATKNSNRSKKTVIFWYKLVFI